MTESKTKKCEICGEIKPIADFSKSYKNRCKACVAAETRMHRESTRVKDNSKIDWEQRRYEIARDVTAGMYSKDTEGRYSNPNDITDLAIRVATMLTEKLKQLK